jgi:hypothetical protein
LKINIDERGEFRLAQSSLKVIVLLGWRSSSEFRPVVVVSLLMQDYVRVIYNHALCPPLLEGICTYIFVELDLPPLVLAS